MDGESKAIDRGRQAWRVEERGDNENQGDGAAQDDEGVAAMINAAKKIEKNNEMACPNNDVVREADCKLVTLKNPDQIRAWFVNKRHEKTESGKPLYNEKQLQVICKVVNRICEEMEDKAHVTEPLLWCMHGGPGVGKSHVLKGLKELFEFVGYQNNVHYVMTALQAVMAEQLEGDTLHHATGLVPKQFKKIPKFETGATKRQQEVSKLLEHCRWFIIDEISMVSAQLLADVEQKLRRMMKDIEATKKDARHMDRVFGGLNVLISGDFWQLDPPSGTALASVPGHLIPIAREYSLLLMCLKAWICCGDRGRIVYKVLQNSLSVYVVKTSGFWMYKRRCEREN